MHLCMVTRVPVGNHFELGARGGRILGPSYFRMPPDRADPLLNGLAMVVLVLVIGLRSQYGDL